MFGRLSIKARIGLILGVSLIGLSVIVAMALATLHGQMMADREAKVRNLVEVGSTLISHYEAEARGGRMPEAEARAAALAALGALRYSGQEYFFVLDRAGIVLGHGADAKLVGRDLTGVTDPNGVHFIRAMLDAARANPQGGFAAYAWPKPGDPDKTPMPKLSYVRTFAPWGWVVATGIYIDDVDAAFAEVARELIGASLAVMIAGVIATLLIGRAIVRPIPRMQAVIAAAGTGDLTGEARVDGRDELATMARDFNGLIGTLRASIARVGEASASVASASVELNASAGDMSRNAERMNERAESITRAVNSVAGAVDDLSSIAEELAANAEAVAAAAEEMGASISEVARHATDSARVSHSAAAAAEQARSVLDGADGAIRQAVDNIREMARASGEIGAVIKVISDIAAQTNLLALNATIEAARAGEAGKGFAVVAGEVKSLATQSAKATEEIERKITTTREQTDRSVASIDEVARMMERVAGALTSINEVIGQIDAIAASIAHEVDQQSAATSEIGRNVARVAGAAREVAKDTAQTSAQARIVKESVDFLAGVARDTAGGATETAAAAGELGRLATDLDRLVGRFKLRA
ncbi:methyl-accepting chemotaxis protein [Azospirillum halopraeferens]|uniref:methyl-accepting chemotaxis protein n=1 Tax=Azospirillum halopraeferens TaxID=34010 RepID=UPI00041F1C58|nr:methyl-accepting chemotaxis protein [Azospirillum halopraeferens]